MIEVAITFGVQYAHEFHIPTAGKAHPDGFWVIEAYNREAARAGALERFGRAWAFDYDLHSESFQESARRYYPRGELGRTRVTGYNVFGRLDGGERVHVSITDVTS